MLLFLIILECISDYCLVPLTQSFHVNDNACGFLQVCGGHSNAGVNGSCSDSRCGGAGCRDNQGNRVCGGEGCNGTVSASVAALNHARNVTDSLNAANEDLQTVARKVLKVFRSEGVSSYVP